MLTLTIDPKLFESPQDAFEYCRKRRVIGELIRALKKAGWLHSDRYFCAFEWQKKTEMIHFHLLVDATIPDGEVRRFHALLCEFWNRNRPAWAGPVVGRRPGFGSVRFTRSFESNGPQQAANYVCKYLTKYPDQGFPAWVLDFEGKIARYSVSKGFWKLGENADEPEAAEEEHGMYGHEPDCFCEKCREAPAKVEGATIRQRIAKCGQETTVVITEEFMKSDGELITRRRFVCKLPLSYQQALAVLEVSERPKGPLTISLMELSRLREAADQRRAAEVLKVRRESAFDDWNAEPVESLAPG